MPSLIFEAMVDGMAKGSIQFATDLIRVLLVTGAYVPDKAAHTRRSDVTGEVIGDGYTAGGEVAAVVVVTDLGSNRTDIALGGAAWPHSTITAAGAVYYDSRGGAPEDDELVAYIDFGGDVSSGSGLFTLQLSTMSIQN